MPEALDPHWITPAWNAPPRVHAVVTTRDGGTSQGVWGAWESGGMNLGFGSGDDRATVMANRALLARRLPREPAWIGQVHGDRAIDAASVPPPTVSEPHAIEADASYTTAPGIVCAILVADCMPVLFCDRAGTRVAAAHAGWRGLAAGVLEATIVASGLDPADTLAWIGPAIGPTRFEVGDDVRDAFMRNGDQAGVSAAFVPHGSGKWLADLPALARLRLAAIGVHRVVASGLCTASDVARFYSYRRDGKTGRMAALIWMDP